MKGVYFLIGVALFVACAFVFINEHGKFYESFDGTNTQATANSQQPNTSSPGTSPSASVVGGGVPSTTSSNTTPTPNANDTPQTPGSTTANPAVSTPSQQDLVGYIDAVSLFSMGVASKGGKDAVLAKLSPDDVSYFNTLYAEIAKIIQYSMAPVTFPYTSAQTANKTKEYIYANQYITVQLSNTPVGASTMRTFVQGSVAGITAPITAGGTNTGSGSASAGSGSSGSSASGSAGSAGAAGAGSGSASGGSSSSGSASGGSSASSSGSAAGGSSSSGPGGYSDYQSMFNQSMFPGNTTTVTGTAGGQGNQPLSGQFTMGGTPMSDYIQSSSTSPDMFAKGKKDAEMCDASDLQELIGLIKAFSDNLKSLNTSEPVIVARLQQVDKLLLDLKEIKQSVEQGKLAPDQIPIRVGDARNFLRQSGNLASQLPNLITSPAIDTTGKKPAAENTNNLQPNNLLDMANYLNGSISLSFDGDLYAREQMAQRVDKIVNMLRTKQITSSDAKHILQALTAIQGQLGPSNYQATDVFKSSWQMADTGSTSLKPGYIPDTDQLNKASDGGDDDIRPGSDSNSYLKRASSAYAAYNYNDLTAPDYKDKLVNLCSNVTKAGLDMGNIGCTNIQNVSPEYGYKGAYLMVCNRLKDTWGGSYPQMFGCPTSN